MKQALCFKDLNDFNRISDNQIETIDFEFVDREICEKPENGWIQLIPYVSFTHFDEKSSKIDIITYRRPSSGEGEARLQGNTSCGFGGHIDSETDLVFTSKEETVDCRTVYKLDLAQIKQSLMNCAARELEEELGINPFIEFEIEDHRVSFGLERESQPDEVGQVHLCISIKANLSKPQFAGILQQACPETSEVENLSAISLDVGAFIGSFNVIEAMKHLEDQLKKDLQMEQWSVLVITTILTQMVDFLQSNWDLSCVMNAIITKLENAKNEEEDDQEEEGVTVDQPLGVPYEQVEEDSAA